jgi:hypothetical protein
MKVSTCFIKRRHIGRVSPIQPASGCDWSLQNAAGTMSRIWGVLERIWGRTIVAYFKMLSQYSHVMTGELHKNYQAVWDLYRLSSEYKSDSLLLQSPRSIWSAFVGFDFVLAPGIEPLYGSYTEESPPPLHGPCDAGNWVGHEIFRLC